MMIVCFLKRVLNRIRKLNKTAGKCSLFKGTLEYSVLFLIVIRKKSCQNQNAGKSNIIFATSMVKEPHRKMPIQTNLQMFAGEGEKTEKATPKRRKDAREKGQVLQSREISSSLILLIVFLSIKLLGSYMYREIESFYRLCVNDLTLTFDVLSVNEIMHLVSLVMVQLLKIIGPVFGIAFVTGVTASYIQVGSLFTTETLKPKFSKLNPVNGIKRIFSLRGLTELIKSLLKITVISIVAWQSIKGEITNIAKLMDQELKSAALYIFSTGIDIAIKICVMMFIIAMLDYAYQWWQYEKDLRMTKQEIIDYKGQARFLRAYLYWMLLRKYGPIPIIQTDDGMIDYTLSYDDIALPRNSYDECVEYITSELVQAAKELNYVSSLKNTNFFL